MATSPETLLAGLGEKQRRKACVLYDLGGPNIVLFAVAPNPAADRAEPHIEIHSQSTVHKHDAEITRIAKQKGIDADLLKAIMYMEETHGWYDAPLDWVGANKSIRPMNINVEFWGDSFGSRESLKDPVKNIESGAEMLRRIIRCMPDGSSTEQIATVYNNIGATIVSDYGARVGYLYEAKFWKVKVPSFW